MVKRILKPTNCRRGQEDNSQTFSVIPPPCHQKMESSSCSSFLLLEQNEQQDELFYTSGHNSIRSTTRSDESNSSSLRFAMHFPFDDDDISISLLSNASLEEFFRQQEEEEEDEDAIHIQSSLPFSAGGLSSRKKTHPSPPSPTRANFNDDLCWIVLENCNDEEVARPLRLQDDQVLHPHTDHTQQEESSPVSLFDQIQAEEEKEGKEDQAMMIMPPVGGIIHLDDSYSHETPHYTDADDKMRSLPTNSTERPSILYNVSDSTISANTTSSYNSSNSIRTLNHEKSSCCLSKSKKEDDEVLPFYPPSFLIDQTRSRCRSRLLQSMKQTKRTQDLIRKEKKKIKLHDSFVDKDVLQELVYCMQDSKKSREKLRQFLLEDIPEVLVVVKEVAVTTTK